MLAFLESWGNILMMHVSLTLTEARYENSTFIDFNVFYVFLLDSASLGFL